MAQPKKWIDEVIATLQDLGGHGTLREIYSRILERDQMDFSANPTWEATVRKTIEMFSSDCDTYTGPKGGAQDLLYAVEGKGKGHWGLRNYVPTEDKLDLTEDFVGFPEGRKLLRLHIVRERNPQVIKIAKQQFVDEHGTLFCEICGFDFQKVYGDIGRDYIEGHHVVPISQLIADQATKPSDIVMVCSNCHRMLHRKRPWLSKDRLKSLLQVELIEV